jgi:hypothetical protein
LVAVPARFVATQAMIAGPSPLLAVGRIFGNLVLSWAHTVCRWAINGGVDSATFAVGLSMVARPAALVARLSWPVGRSASKVCRRTGNDRRAVTAARMFCNVGRVAVNVRRADNVSRKAVTVAGSVSNVGGRAGNVGRRTVNGTGAGNIGLKTVTVGRSASKVGRRTGNGRRFVTVARSVSTVDRRAVCCESSLERKEFVVQVFIFDAMVSSEPCPRGLTGTVATMHNVAWFQYHRCRKHFKGL